MIFATAVGKTRLANRLPTLTHQQILSLYRLMHCCGNEAAVRSVLDTANKYLEGHGVESINGELLYVNMGDPYIPTLIYDAATNRFAAEGYGDYIDSSLARRRRFQNL